MRDEVTHVRRAGYGGGAFTTRPFVFAGNELELNYSTSAVGHVKVELQDESGAALNGYSLTDSQELFGDEIAGTIGWRDDGANIGDLAGQTVRMRAELRDADLFAFRFR